MKETINALLFRTDLFLPILKTNTKILLFDLSAALLLLIFISKSLSSGKANKKLITPSPLKTQKKKKMKIIRAIKQPESVPLHFLIQISAYICCTMGTKRHITFQNRLVFTVHSYLSKLFFPYPELTFRS